MHHVVDAPGDTVRVETTAASDLARTTVTCELQPGERLRLVKFVAYAWSGERPAEALVDDVDAALLVARRQGWQGLVAAQHERLSRFWQVADIEVDGDPALQQAARFALFHVFQAGARAEGRAIPAKGLTGFGYNGHAFWDTETFVLPVYSYTSPVLAADALRWRHSTLAAAQRRADQLHLHGAAFPWRTIDGQECSGYWPAGTAAFHVNADIAAAVLRHERATRDSAFEREVGLDLLAGTARLWMSLGHHGADGAFHIDGVTGPDEYSAIVDDNVYTNLMAAQNLRAAADGAARHPHHAAELGIDGDETARWRAAADAMAVPFDDRLGVHAQSRGFTEHERWNFARTRADQYPLLQHFPYVELYRRQVVKQADLVLAMHLRHDAFTEEQKAQNFAYYEQLTVRDSSLSAAPQAIIAVEVGQLGLARDYLAELAGMDLDDLHRDTDRGVHLAALAGIWHVLVAGFGGMRHDDELRFRPRLPPGSTRLAFRLRVGSGMLHVEIRESEASYRWQGSGERRVVHYGRPVLLGAERVTRPIPPARPVGSRPQQPPTRDPRRIVADR
jgi:alpha,alpha-trehalose phosphorylase